MEKTELISDGFWRGTGVHLALPPEVVTLPRLVSMLETVGPYLPEGGCLFRTSGSEGVPKWVALEKRAFLHSARVVNAHYDLTGADHWLVALPLHHVAGFAICARAWAVGAEVSFFEGRWEVEAVVKLMRERRITAVSLVPTQVHDLVNAGLAAPEWLRLVLVGGGRFEPDLMRRALALGWPVCATYGMTETASGVACQALDHDRAAVPEVLEVLPHWQVGVDAAGVLTVKGPALAKGYVIGEGAGWVWRGIDPAVGLRTRDLAQVWDDGTRSFLRFLGRESACVKVLGELVYLDQVERRLRQLGGAGLGELMVVAEPEARREQALVLLAETEDEAAIEALLQRFHAECQGFERIQHWQTGVSFERTALGKLRRL
jgi:o-succinylbenzoate---CoA ligase